MNTAFNNHSCKFPNKNVFHLNSQLLRLRFYIFVKCVKNVFKRPQKHGIEAVCVWEGKRKRNIDRVWTMRTTKRENWKKNFSHVSCIAISTILCSLSHAMQWRWLWWWWFEKSLKDSFPNIYKYIWILFFMALLLVTVTSVVHEETAKFELQNAIKMMCVVFNFLT